ncbi:MAG: hypothetical protein KJO07_02565 [Deltaproteobacteria bacterium]|nr:hypothetical protein [Deltaproteobacteria bacterium]
MDQRLRCPACGKNQPRTALEMAGHPGMLRCGGCAMVTTSSDRALVTRPARVSVEVAARSPRADGEVGPYRSGWQPPSIVVRTKTSWSQRIFGAIPAGVALLFLYLALFGGHPLWALFIDYGIVALAGFAAIVSWLDNKIELDSEAMINRAGERLGRSRVKALTCRERSFLYHLEAECVDGRRIDLNAFEQPEDAVYVMSRLEDALDLQDEEKARFLPAGAGA